MRVTRPTPRVTRAPWVIRREHQQDEAARMLRLLAKREAGTLPADRVRSLDRWLDRMAADDLVVCYHPDSGFTYQLRLPDEPKGTLTRV